jgi:hypothetical protein
MADAQARAFRGFRFPAEAILWAVRWCLRFPVSYRDLEAMLADRGVGVDHTSMYRRIQHFAPELEKRTRRHPRPRPCRGRRGYHHARPLVRAPMSCITTNLPRICLARRIAKPLN